MIKSRWNSAMAASIRYISPALAGGGVDALLEEPERDPAPGELVKQGDQAAHPVQTGRDQDVAGARRLGQCVPGRSG
jgi:hypothetical protein